MMSSLLFYQYQFDHIIEILFIYNILLMQPQLVSVGKQEITLFKQITFFCPQQINIFAPFQLFFFYLLPLLIHLEEEKQWQCNQNHVREFEIMSKGPAKHEAMHPTTVDLIIPCAHRRHFSNVSQWSVSHVADGTDACLFCSVQFFTGCITAKPITFYFASKKHRLL